MNQKDKEGNTALIMASRNGHTEIVRVLLRAGSDRSIKNKKGTSAADRAREAGHAEIVTLLEQKAE